MYRHRKGQRKKQAVEMSEYRESEATQEGTQTAEQLDRDGGDRGRELCGLTDCDLVLLPCSGLCWPWAAMWVWQMRRQRTT